MNIDNNRWTDERVERIIGKLLRTGVIAAASVVLVGGILYLVRHGTEPAGHQVFVGEPADLRSPVGIIVDTLNLQSRGLIQLGILLMIAIPVARVVFSVWAFAQQGDRIYVLITLLVLSILFYSLFSGQLS
jgi:uncharacterized membrane protein